MKKLLLVVMAVSLSIILVGCSQPTIVFELNGKSNVTVLQDRDYNDLGFTAEKSGGLDLSKYVTISESISTEFVGTKTITYTLDYEDTKQTITREVEVVPALTKEMAYDFFSNVDLSLMEFFPDSFRESIDPLSVVQNTNCTLNEDDKYTFADEVYDYCITSTDSILPMSDSYVDIYSSMKQFELIEKYTNTILHSMDSVSDVTHIDGIDVMTPYGSIGMEITDDITDDSVTFEGQFSYNQGVEVALDISAELTYDYLTELYKVRYGYDISVGYSFFGVTFYHMYAEAVIDNEYNLQSLDIYNNVPFVSTKATALTIVDNSTVEMLSYYSVVGLFESKAYIYANDTYGYAYKLNDALGFDPKTYYDVFTEDTMVLSYESKPDYQESKYYLQGLDGWQEAYYLIDVFGPNNDLDSVILLDDNTYYLLTEDDFDNNPEVGYTIDKEDAVLYYYSELEDDIEQFVYDTPTLFFYQHSDKGSINPFAPPIGLTAQVPFNVESNYLTIQSEMENYVVLGVLLFDVAGFDFEIPIEQD